MSQAIEDHDQVQHFWCPMLGQPINFGYCRKSNEGLPCSRVIACFSPHFEVTAFLEEHYSQEQRDTFLAPPPGRVERMAQALNQAAKAGGEPKS